MLIPETPFPHAGSYALLVDPGARPPQPAELVRILARETMRILVGFPLRDGASGNKAVGKDDLIDASPLTPAEEREYHDLDRELRGREIRTPRLKKLQARRAELRVRMIYAPLMARLIRQAATRRSAA
jgi:hypothetical protein